MYSQISEDYLIVLIVLVAVHQTPFTMASNGSAHAAAPGHADEYKNHLFPPNSASQGAHVSSREQYDEMYKRSINDPDSFWGEIAESFYWKKRWQSPVRR